MQEESLVEDNVITPLLQLTNLLSQISVKHSQIIHVSIGNFYLFVSLGILPFTASKVKSKRV